MNAEGELVELADGSFLLGGEDKVHSVGAGYGHIHGRGQVAPGGVVGAGGIDTGPCNGFGGDGNGADFRAAIRFGGSVEVDADFTVHGVLGLGNQDRHVYALRFGAEVQILKANLGAVGDANDGATVQRVLRRIIDHIPVVIRCAAQGRINVKGLAVGLGEDRRPQVASNVGRPGAEGIDAAADGGGVLRRSDTEHIALVGDGDLF